MTDKKVLTSKEQMVPLKALKDLYRAYVRLLESGKERIEFHGGTCDSVEQMEKGDPYLIAARVAVQAAEIDAKYADETGDDLAKVYDAFQIGSAVRTPATLLANVENSKRRSDCLSAIEREFFTYVVADEDGEDMERCDLSWGADPSEYVAQFRVALSKLNSSVETTRELSASEAASFDKTLARSPRRVDPLPAETRAATSRGARSTEDAGRPESLENGRTDGGN